VRVFLSRFIAYPREHAKVAHVLWIVRAHLMRAADAVQAQGQVKTVSALIPPQPLASPRAAAFIFRLSSRYPRSSGVFDLVRTNEKVGRNFPSLTDLVDHLDRERAPACENLRCA